MRILTQRGRQPGFLYPCVGLGIGLLLLLAAFTFAFHHQNLPFSWLGLKDIHEAQPMVWIVDISALLFAIFGFWAGRSTEKTLITHQQLELDIIERTEELGRLSETLQYEIFERKKMQESLMAAKEIAVKASRAKSDFLTKMSHEIRTPMNGILGMVDLLSDGFLNKDQKDYLETIRFSAECLLNILDDILDFAQIGSGKIALNQKDFSLRALIADLVPPLSVQASQKGLTLNYLLDPKIPEKLQGDSRLLKRILMKLLGNAIKYTEKGHVELEIQQRAHSGAQVALHFTVLDTGIGIPKEKQRIIFNAFAQGDDSPSRRFGGTGLGLAISSQLVAIMGGNIMVESEVNQGSRFDFIISFTTSEDQALALPESEKGFSSTTTIPDLNYEATAG